MKGSPAVPGGSLTSKPTRWKTCGCSATSAFLFLPVRDRCDRLKTHGSDVRHENQRGPVSRSASILDFDAARCWSTARTGSHMGYWLVERARCCWQGHRDLSRTPSYAAVLADGRIRELHFCLACGSLVWTERRPTTTETSFTWKNLQI